jgi:hypothetical protein
VSENGKAEAVGIDARDRRCGAPWGSVGLYGDIDFALQLALQKGKCAASVRHDCKASVSRSCAITALLFKALSGILTMMNGEEAVRVYEVLWSILAICGGLFLLLRSRWFIELNARAFETLYHRTGLAAFRVQSHEMRKPYMNVLVPLLGVGFVAVGILILFSQVSV